MHVRKHTIKQHDKFTTSYVCMYVCMLRFTLNVYGSPCSASRAASQELLATRHFLLSILYLPFPSLTNISSPASLSDMYPRVGGRPAAGQVERELGGGTVCTSRLLENQLVVWWTV